MESATSTVASSGSSYLKLPLTKPARCLVLIARFEGHRSRFVPMPTGRDSWMMTQCPDGMALGEGVQTTPDDARLHSPTACSPGGCGFPLSMN